MPDTDTRSAAKNAVGPHEFAPLRRPAITDNARCRACYLPKWAHPIKAWVASRPLGDRRPALRNGIVKGGF